MSFSFGRLHALIRKEFQDFLRNGQGLPMAFMPVLIAFGLSLIDSFKQAGLFMILMPVLMAFTMTGIYTQAMLIAEEKEKQTLRVLMLSPASPIEVLLGKSILTIFFTLFSITACVFLSGLSSVGTFWFWIIALLSVLTFVSIGTVIGLLCKSTVETVYYGMPVVFLFLFGSTFAPLVDADWLTKLVVFFPTQQFIDAVDLLQQGRGIGDVGVYVLKLLIWLAVSVLLCLIVYRRKRFEE